MGIPKFEKDVQVIQKLADLPNADNGLTADGLKAKFDAAAEMVKAFLNETLIPALVAGNIPFARSTEIDADNVQDALAAVHGQIRDAVTGTLVNGSVTKEKLSPELLERVFGGRTWVSMDVPTEEDNVERFPVGQVWMRPGFTVKNEALDSWVCVGCTVADGVVTGSRTAVSATASQIFTGIGREGDRVKILFDMADRNGEVSGITVSVNGGETVDVTGSHVLDGKLDYGGSLSLLFTTTWSSAALAEDGWTMKDLTVVNLDAAVRQTEEAKEPADWTALLQGMRPFVSRTFPAEAFMQTGSGHWWPLAVKAAEDGYLKTVGGQPKWMTAAETMGDLGGLRSVRGSYVGTGEKGSVELPVAPVLLVVAPESGPIQGPGDDYVENPMTLFSGTTARVSMYISETGSGAISGYAVSLAQNTLMVEGKALNRKGITYHWTAIY